MYLNKIISGGQTGSDIAGLKVAKEFGLQTGGMMPQGWKTLDGPKPEYKDLYGMIESDSPSYKGRTFWNVKVADATVRFAANFDSPGEKCTLNAVKKWDKPCFDWRIGDYWKKEFIDFLNEHKVKILNIAGNSERTTPGIEEKVKQYLRDILNELATKS
jgi:hypothetical protein